MGTTGIVVGTDGSSSGRAAVRWAAAEAVRRGDTLRVLTVYHAPWPDLRSQGPEAVDQAMRQRTEPIIHAALTDAAAVAPGVRVHGVPVAGDPTGTLLAASAADAGLLVLGSRGHSAMAATVLGSVSRQVAARAAGPVTVVRGRGETAIGPIIAGLDSSSDADVILGAAFEEAATRGCALAVVTAVTQPTAPWGAAEIPTIPVSPAAVESEHRKELHDAVRPWADKYPDVPLELVVAKGDAGRVLVHLSGSAQLVVVGSHGHGTLAGLLLGSVVLRLLHHADCPVLIARRHGGARP